MKFNRYHFIALAVMFLLPSSLLAQLDYGGTPLSFSSDAREAIPVVNLQKPNMEKIRKQDSISEKQFKPYRFAAHIDTDISFSDQADWQKTEEGWIGRLAIKAKDAKGLLFYYDKFDLPAAGRLFLYTKDKRQLLGAYTYQNNPSSPNFATEIVHNEKVIIEYNYLQDGLVKPDINISEVGYAYRGIDFLTKSFGDSGDCEVNINCSEGNEWQDQKKAVIRIAIKNPEGSFWCTGSLVNNTQQDYTPYMLSADHCAGEASASDIDQWVFFFNYEAEGCENPSVEPEYSTMVGAEKRANGGDGGATGSDFYLVELNQLIPNYINAYYNGWSRSGVAAESGVSIHHPQGDLKKISTFTQKLTSTGFGNTDYESHWEVFWSPTANGHGVTEPGSSGSPLFNQNGLIVGTLTGGYASCESANREDFYGKFSYSWERNGDRPEDRLRDWLDPNDVGVNALSGLGGEPQQLQANFSTQDTSIIIGGTASFSNMAVGAINSYQWSFEGGTPGSSDEMNPGEIQYSDYGRYDVKLVISGPNGSDTLMQKDMIHVIARAYPNPVTNQLILDFGAEPIGDLNVRIYNSMGIFIREFDDNIEASSTFTIDMADYPSGIYLVRVESNGNISEYKILRTVVE